jgi:hypothetical protein
MSAFGNSCRILVNILRKDTFERLGVNGRIILKLIHIEEIVSGCGLDLSLQ